MYGEMNPHLKAWMKEDKKNRRRCTGCGAGIEKTGGCNNVHCSNCGHYICWVCMASYDVMRDCYNHLDAQHGGAFGAIQDL